jgi:hypothetical protein
MTMRRTNPPTSDHTRQSAGTLGSMETINNKVMMLARMRRNARKFIACGVWSGLSIYVEGNISSILDISGVTRKSISMEFARHNDKL